MCAGGRARGRRNTWFGRESPGRGDQGKLCADYEGVKSVARQVLRHRILTNFNARAQKITVTDVIDKLLGEVHPDRGATRQ